MDYLIYLFGAFALAWALVFAYLYGLCKQQKRLESELDLLDQRINRQSE